MEKELERADKIVWIQGLMVECPMRDPQEDCPLQPLRETIPLTERLKMVKDMTADEMDEIIEHHKECIRKREA